MNVSYKRGMDHNYMIISDIKTSMRNYQIRMLEENTLNHILNMSVSKELGVNSLRYEISSMQPLSRLYEHKEIGPEDIRKILEGIISSYYELHDYMLDETHVVLNSDYIYMNVETKELKLLFHIDYEKTMSDSFIELAEYLMDKVDHNSEKAVMYAYKLYRVVKNNNFIIGDIKGIIEESDKKTAEKIEVLDVPDKKDEIIEEEETQDILDENIIKKPSLFRLRGWFSKNKKEETVNIIDSKEDIDIEENIINEPFREDEEEYGKTVILTNDNLEENSNHYLVQTIKGKEITRELKNYPATIGKVENTVDVVIKDSSISRMHARILYDNGLYYLQDLGSTNGTFVNSMQLDAEEKIMIESGDELRFGKVKMEFR